MLAIMKFPHTFMPFACHGSLPAMNVARPIVSNKAVPVDQVQPRPPVTTNNFFASAASGRPNTGALR